MGAGHAPGTEQKEELGKPGPSQRHVALRPMPLVETAMHQPQRHPLCGGPGQFKPQPVKKHQLHQQKWVQGLAIGSPVPCAATWGGREAAEAAGVHPCEHHVWSVQAHCASHAAPQQL